MIVYSIEGSNYDSCNGWSHWETGELFKLKTDAEERAKERNITSSFSRYNVIEIEVK